MRDAARTPPSQIWQFAVCCGDVLSEIANCCAEFRGERSLLPVCWKLVDSPLEVYIYIYIYIDIYYFCLLEDPETRCMYIYIYIERERYIYKETIYPYARCGAHSAVPDLVVCGLLRWRPFGNCKLLRRVSRWAFVIICLLKARWQSSVSVYIYIYIYRYILFLFAGRSRN